MMGSNPEYVSCGLKQLINRLEYAPEVVAQAMETIRKEWVREEWPAWDIVMDAVSQAIDGGSETARHLGGWILSNREKYSEVPAAHVHAVVVKLLATSGVDV